MRQAHTQHLRVPAAALAGIPTLGRRALAALALRQVDAGSRWPEGARVWLQQLLLDEAWSDLHAGCHFRQPHCRCTDSDPSRAHKQVPIGCGIGSAKPH